LQSSISFLDFLRTAFWTIGRGLDPSIFKDRVGAITNFGLRVLAVRALHKTGDKRQSYGKSLRELNRRFLEMLERPGLDTSVQWPEPLPEDPKELLTQLQMEIQMEVTSHETAAEELGRSWLVEQARIEAEKRANVSLGEMLLRDLDKGGGKPPFGESRQANRETGTQGDGGEE
jgi:hypothetical protein